MDERIAYMMGLMNPEVFVRRLGWDTWYHPDYWVHPKTIDDPKSQDYTNYGMRFWDIFLYEADGCPKFKQRFGIPFLNMVETIREMRHG